MKVFRMGSGGAFGFYYGVDVVGSGFGLLGEPSFGVGRLLIAFGLGARVPGVL